MDCTGVGLAAVFKWNINTPDPVNPDVRPWRLNGFPDSEHAMVTEEKVCDYLLNANHPVGGP